MLFRLFETEGLPLPAWMLELQQEVIFNLQIQLNIYSFIYLFVYLLT